MKRTFTLTIVDIDEEVAHWTAEHLSDLLENELNGCTERARIEATIEEVEAPA